MDYTKSQSRAIAAINQNLQIIACAGSGKTQVISRRIVTSSNRRRRLESGPSTSWRSRLPESRRRTQGSNQRPCCSISGTDEGLRGCTCVRSMGTA